jgi:hypothetical protein
MTGLPHPTCRHVRFLTAARLTLHGCTLPVLFHTGGTLGVAPFRAFPFREAVRLSAPDTFLTLFTHVLCDFNQPNARCHMPMTGGAPPTVMAETNTVNIKAPVQR